MTPPAQGLHQAAIGGGVTVSPGRGDRQTENDNRNLFAWQSQGREIIARLPPIHASAMRRVAHRYARRGRGSGGGADAAGLLRRSAARAARPPRTVSATRISRPGSKNCAIPSHASVMMQAAGPGGLEYPRRRAEAVCRHAVPADVQHGECGALNALWSRVYTWPRYATLGGRGLSAHPAPPSRNRRSGKSAATSRKNRRSVARGRAADWRASPRSQQNGARAATG